MSTPSGEGGHIISWLFFKFKFFLKPNITRDAKKKKKCEEYDNAGYFCVFIGALARRKTAELSASEKTFSAACNRDTASRHSTRNSHFVEKKLPVSVL